MPGQELPFTQTEYLRATWVAEGSDPKKLLDVARSIGQDSERLAEHKPALALSSEEDEARLDVYRESDPREQLDEEADAFVFHSKWLAWAVTGNESYLSNPHSAP